MHSVSVVIPTYNQARYVDEAIGSVLAQLRRPVEVIVVDDGSTDETPELLQRYAAPVRVIRQANGGVAGARNAGAAAARGEFIAFLDSDDVWHPRKLLLQLLRFEQDPELGMVYCGGEWFDDADGASLGCDVDGCEGWIAPELLRFRRTIIAAGSSSVMPRRVFDDVGGYDTRIRSAEDWELGFRIACRYRVGFVAEPLLRRRIHPAGMHFDARAYHRGMMLALHKIFSGDTAQELRHLKSEAYAGVHRSLAAMYLAKRELAAFGQHALRSVLYDEQAMNDLAAAVRAELRRRQGKAAAKEALPKPSS